MYAFPCITYMYILEIRNFFDDVTWHFYVIGKFIKFHYYVTFKIVWNFMVPWKIKILECSRMFMNDSLGPSRSHFSVQSRDCPIDVIFGPPLFFNFGIQPRYDLVKLEKYIFLKYLYGLWYFHEFSWIYECEIKWHSIMIRCTLPRC